MSPTPTMPVPPSASKPNPARRGLPAGLKKLAWPAAALAALLLFNFIFTPGFFRITLDQGHLYGSLIDIPKNATPVMIVCLGMTLVIATGGVDLSVGAVMAIAGALAAVMFKNHVPAFWVFAAVLAVGALAGAWNGLLVSGIGIQPIIATLILMVCGRGIAQLLTSGQILRIQNDAVDFLGAGHLLGLPLRLTLVAALMLIMLTLTRTTALGLFVESVGDNPLASRYVGLRVRAITAAVYVICGLLAAIAGLVAAADIRNADSSNAGLYVELDAIFAVVIGGTPLVGGRFHLLGSIIGALIIQTLSSTLKTRNVPVQYELVVKAVVVLVVCLLQSDSFRAMFRRRSAR